MITLSWWGYGEGLGVQQCISPLSPTVDIRGWRSIAKPVLLKGSFSMRRVYVMDSRRKQIVQEAILQMRATREALGPEFLARIRMLVRDFDPSCLPPDHFSSPGSRDGSEPIDRRKNLLIIMKFLQLKEHDKNIQNQVRTLLSDSNTIQ